MSFETTSSRRGLKSNDIILKEGAEIITDKSRIANIFNEYFVNIANHIEAPSEEVYGRDFADHPSVMAISGSVSSSFSFSPTNSTCVKQLLLDINIRKSPGYDNITPRLLKLSAECAAEPLCAIFNAALISPCIRQHGKRDRLPRFLKARTVRSIRPYFDR